MRKISSYTEAEKAQLLEEVKMVGNVARVAKKHNMPPATIYSWIKPKKRKEKIFATKEDITKIKNQLAESELENKLLKEILKKTYQVWQTG